MNAPSHSVSVVTGGGRGIGRAIALALAAEGRSLAILARTENELHETTQLIESAGGTAGSYAVDIIDEAAVRRAIGEIERTLGPIELLVNAAGSGRGVGPVWEIDSSDWWQDVEVNLRGTYHCIRAVLPSMQSRGHGRIVNISSSLGNVPAPYLSSYGCSKSAVQHLTETLALEVAPFGIQVFALDPGLVWTAMSRHVIESDACRRWMPNLSRVGPDQCVPPEQAAEQVVRLASGRYDALLGRFVTFRTDLDAVVGRLAEVERDGLYVLRLRGLPPIQENSG
jgi:NAD(P)-dependent dehydrogenase (short-subunit alcohol dehydrogenase family)